MVHSKQELHPHSLPYFTYSCQSKGCVTGHQRYLAMSAMVAQSNFTRESMSKEHQTSSKCPGRTIDQHDLPDFERNGAQSIIARRLLSYRWSTVMFQGFAAHLELSQMEFPTMLVLPVPLLPTRCIALYAGRGVWDPRSLVFMTVLPEAPCQEVSIPLTLEQASLDPCIR